MLKRLLITVKTYPAISTKYQEIVCTAGVDLTSDPKRFIRIYPIPFRKLPYSKQYKKYEIWEFQVKKAEKDHRIDSFHLIDPKVGGTKVDYISTGKNRDWQDRKQIILPLLAKSMCDLQGNYKAFPKTAPTLGLIKPCDVEFIVEPDEREWVEKKKTIIAQAIAFGVIHFLAYNLEIAGIITASICGLALGIMYIYTGSELTVCLSHMLYNLITILLTWGA